MSDPPAPSETRALLRQTPFLFLLGGRFLSSMGVQVQGTAIAWQVYSLARESASVNEAAFILSMIGLAQFLPVLFLTLSAGQAADHHDRRRIMVIALSFDLVFTTALGLLAVFRPTLWPIFVIAAMFGASRAFIMPAGGALAPMLVPRELMPRALAWSSLAWQTASILGPAVGGLMVAVSTGAAYGAAAALYILAITSLSLIRANCRPEPHGGSRWEMMKEGLAYVWREKIVFGAISLDLFAVLLGGATLLLPVFAADVLHVGATGFGVLRAAPAVGAALVAILLAARPVRRHAGLVMFTGVAVFAVATIVFGLSKWPALSVIALAVLGGADMLSVYVRQTLVQIVTPDGMRGRVAAVSSLFIGASNELGEFESGLVARFLGPVGAAVFGGIGALLVTGLWARLFPALRKADRLA
jgi:MFS family permease